MLSLVFGVLVVAYLVVTGSKPSAAVASPVGAAIDLSMDPIYKKVCSDAVEQYNIAKRNGTPIDVCAHAGMVAAAFLQAKDEAHYRSWKQTEQVDCAKAGVPSN